MAEMKEDIIDFENVLRLEEKRKKIKAHCDSMPNCEGCKLLDVIGISGDGQKIQYCCSKFLPDKYIEEYYEALFSTEAVNHPKHYQGKHECIEVMRAMFGDEAVKGFCRCNAYKYRFRAGSKEGNSAEQDIKKAEWYEDYLIMLERKELLLDPLECLTEFKG